LHSRRIEVYPAQQFQVHLLDFWPTRYASRGAVSLKMKYQTLDDRVLESRFRGWINDQRRDCAPREPIERPTRFENDECAPTVSDERAFVGKSPRVLCSAIHGKGAHLPERRAPREISDFDHQQ